MEPLDNVDESDFGTNRPIEVEGLIAEIMLLRKRIRQLQPDGDDESNLEEIKEVRDGKRQEELLDVRINSKGKFIDYIG